MLRKSIVFAVVAALALAVGTGIAVFTQEEEVPAIPGITAEDTHPNGCVDCHRERPDIDRDFRLSKYIEEWATEGAPEEILELAQAAWPEASLSGKHPGVSGMIATQEVPNICLQCHGSNSDKALDHLVHTVHFHGGAENHFITGYGGFCTQCHATNLDVENPPTGEMIIKSGKEGQ